ncbi:hypothetical protein ZHAS_00022003 [Anopheles sinensis]|uniref:Uncharacterized protein n=1 Tax=Anopheles sinensis TaxID=74873 RepID=A0A084WTY1_ANOSI|nr:hypothetical protein ZHAS_00022003 [Anopheles sinensis]
MPSCLQFKLQKWNEAIAQDKDARKVRLRARDRSGTDAGIVGPESPECGESLVYFSKEADDFRRSPDDLQDSHLITLFAPGGKTGSLWSVNSPKTRRNPATRSERRRFRYEHQNVLSGFYRWD